MTIDVLDTLEALERLAPEWRELHLRCPRATPFQSPQWLLPWTRYLFQGGEIQALAMRQHGELVGFAPLFCWGLGRRTVSFLGVGISDYGDLLFAPGRESECVGAVWQFLQNRREGWDVLDLQEVRCGSGLLDAPLEGQQTLRCTAQACSVCPVLDLRTYPDTMDRKHRTDVRRARNRLERSSPLRLSLAGPTDFASHMDAFLRLYECRWGPMEEALRRFHREAAAEFLADGLLRLGLLRSNGAAGAAIYAFKTGPALYCYLSGFDPAMAKSSPGAVLLGWMIEQAIAEGMRQVDFLRQPEPYKYLWGAKDRVNYKLGSINMSTVSADGG